jgi:hypothetical protein
MTQHNLKLNFNDGTRSDGTNFKCEFPPIRIISYETLHAIRRKKYIYLYTRQIHMIQHVGTGKLQLPITEERKSKRKQAGEGVFKGF